MQVKLCDPRLSALSVVATIKALYKYTSFLFSFPTTYLQPGTHTGQQRCAINGSSPSCWEPRLAFLLSSSMLPPLSLPESVGPLHPSPLHHYLWPFLFTSHSFTLSVCLFCSFYSRVLMILEIVLKDVIRSHRGCGSRQSRPPNALGRKTAKKWFY